MPRLGLLGIVPIFKWTFASLGKRVNACHSCLAIKLLKNLDVMLRTLGTMVLSSLYTSFISSCQCLLLRVRPDNSTVVLSSTIASYPRRAALVATCKRQSTYRRWRGSHYKFLKSC